MSNHVTLAVVTHTQKATFTVHGISVNVNMCFQRLDQMVSKSRYQIAHAKSGIRKLGYALIVLVASTANSGARGCPVIARGTRVASYATRSTAMLVAGEYKYTVHVTHVRVSYY